MRVNLSFAAPGLLPEITPAVVKLRIELAASFRSRLGIAGASVIPLLLS